MSLWKESTLEGIALINPAETLKKGVSAKKVAMEVLRPFTKRVSSFSIENYNGGMKFRNGDTIVARITPCLENGKTAFIDILGKNEIGFGSTEYIVIREREGISDKHFLYYFSTSKEFRDVAILSMTGSSGRQRVQTDVLKNHLFSFPALSEQSSIAGFLSGIDDKIGLLYRQNTTLELMMSALFRQWFVEQANVNGKKGRLFDIADHQKVAVVPNENPDVIYHHYSIPAFDDGMRPVLERGKEIMSNKYVVCSGSILVSKLNPRFPRVWAMGDVVQESSICSTEFQVVLPKSKEFFSFIYCFLRSRPVIDELVGAAGGTSGSHQRVRPEDIFNLGFQMPPDKSLGEFNKIVDPLVKKMMGNISQIHTLQKLRDALLPKLMSGEVRVRAR